MASEGRPGRPEGPLDPAAGAVAALAAQLRQLRENAGRPSYRQLARSAYYSHSALSQAAAGRVLPSLAVTLAFVEACGGDRQEWIAQWHEAAAKAGVRTEPDGQAVSAMPVMDAMPVMNAMPTAGTKPTVDDGRTVASRRGIRTRLTSGRRGWRLLATASLAILAGILVGWRLSVGAATLPGGLTAPPNEGDPASVGYCAFSWVSLDSHQVLSGNRQRLGSVELRYSTRCGTAWARFIPAPSLSATRGVTITVEAIRDPDGMTRRSGALYVSNVLSGEILLPAGDCARAGVTVAIQGQAPASAITGCQPPPP